MNTLTMPASHEFSVTIEVQLSDGEAEAIHKDVFFAREYRGQLSQIIARKVAEANAGFVEEIVDKIIDTIQTRSPENNNTSKGSA
ncbi:MAG: hypothetical protein WB870_17035 [Gallionellaceae bacterium]